MHEFVEGHIEEACDLLDLDTDPMWEWVKHKAMEASASLQEGEAQNAADTPELVPNPHAPTLQLRQV